MVRLIRGYYLGTPVFFLADVRLGVNVRVAFLDQWPAGKTAYYIFAFVLGLIAWRRPEWTAKIGLLESGFAGELRMPLAVLLALDDAGKQLGFAELSIRAYAEDCVTDKVAYLEGWYVVPEARRRGVGRALVAAAEEWARGQGCTEFASDALLDNAPSAAAHRALGFVETVQIRCFRKVL
ncbi:MAG: GNAT family N-acetyltransferase [Gemmatimonadales bacterium]